MDKNFSIYSSNLYYRCIIQKNKKKQIRPSNIQRVDSAAEAMRF